LLGLARALRNRGHTQRIVTPEHSALTLRARQEGFDTVALSGPVGLRRLVQNFQIVHSHSGRAQTLSFVATAGLPVLRVTTRHVAFEPRYPSIHRLKYNATCHGVIAVSQAVRGALVSAGVSRDKVEVIPNGVELPAGLPSEQQRALARSKYGFDSHHFVAGHLGAFTPEKGQDVAIEAASLLSERIPQLRLILAGENPPVAQASPRVLFPGFIQDRDEFFAALDLFIMPSLSEGWGLAVAEALAHSVPVVASATGGLLEIVEPGETGWLVPPGDPQALADAIFEAASDPERLRRMGALGGERSARFSVARTAELTEAFYRRFWRNSRKTRNG